MAHDQASVASPLTLPTGTRVRLRSVQEPASALRGLVMRAFGRRELAGTLKSSLDDLERALTPG